MPDLAPGIYFFVCNLKDVHGRDKPGHDLNQPGILAA
jgi:hypothetical protein